MDIPVTVPEEAPFNNPPALADPYARACQLLRSVMPHEIAETLLAQGQAHVSSKSGRIYRLSLSEKTIVCGYHRCIEFANWASVFGYYGSQVNIDRVVMEYVLIRCNEPLYLATAAY